MCINREIYAQGWVCFSNTHSASSSVSQLARGCSHPHTSSWQQFTFRVARVNISMWINVSHLLSKLRVSGDCSKGTSIKMLNMFNNPLQGYSIIFMFGGAYVVPCLSHRRGWNIASPSGRFPSQQPTGVHTQSQPRALLERFPWFLGCSALLISFIVQVETLGVVAMETKQLAGIQIWTWRVAYLQAFGSEEIIGWQSALILC